MGVAKREEAGAVSGNLLPRALSRHLEATTLERLTHHFVHPFRSRPNLNVVL